MRSVERILVLLQELAASGSSLALSELSTRLALPPSTLHRMLATLARHGFVVQDSLTRRYRLGPAVLQLGDHYVRQLDLNGLAGPEMRRLSALTGETVFLTVFEGGACICVDTAESPRPLRFFMRVGQRMPFHSAASAKAILAFRDAAEIDEALAHERYERFTPSTPRDAAAVRRDLEQIRAQGYAVCDEDMEIGVTALAAPIRDARGQVIASVTLVAPAERLAVERRAEPLRQLLATAAAISERLGYRPAVAPGRGTEEASGWSATSAERQNGADRPSAAGRRRARVKEEIS